jgi:hypothetical protein
LRKALARSLKAAASTSRLPKPLQSPDGLARAVIAIHDGVMEHLLLYPDVKQLRRWLADMLNGLLG